jgi:murein DD-endopeptidase MepM/ murein hydrolase activator NlpD
MVDNSQKKRKKIFRKLKHTYRLVFFNDSTFEEVWHFRFTLINVLSITGTVIILLVGGSIALVMFTPLRELVPGYPTEVTRREMVTNVLRLDSLEYEIQLRDKYFNMLNAIISGREPEITDAYTENNGNVNYDNITFTRSEQDSLLRKQVEEEEQFNFVVRAQPASEDASISKIHFFKPLDGVITNKFDMHRDHFGIDIVASPNEVVKSILDGTVIMATWTVETGYVIQVQHASNILSIYKHNASLLKKAGDRVKGGDAVAIVGNSGELTTGPHLHFELWQNGIAVNPEEYIVF